MLSGEGATGCDLVANTPQIVVNYNDSEAFTSYDEGLHTLSGFYNPVADFRSSFDIDEETEETVPQDVSAENEVMPEMVADDGMLEDDNDFLEEPVFESPKLSQSVLPEHLAETKDGGMIALPLSKNYVTDDLAFQAQATNSFEDGQGNFKNIGVSKKQESNVIPFFVSKYNEGTAAKISGFEERPESQGLEASEGLVRIERALEPVNEFKNLSSPTASLIPNYDDAFQLMETQLDNLPEFTSQNQIYLSPGNPLVEEGGLIVEASETLAGSGEIVGGVINYGVFSPGNSPGVVTINGDLTIFNGDTTVIDDSYIPPVGSDTAGELVIEIGGLTPGPGPVGDVDNGYDQIRVNGDVNLGGNLTISLINNFSPSLGDTFDFLVLDDAAGAFSGAFDDATGLYGFGNGSLYFDVIQSSDKLQLEVTCVLA